VSLLSWFPWCTAEFMRRDEMGEGGRYSWERQSMWLRDWGFKAAWVLAGKGSRVWCSYPADDWVNHAYVMKSQYKSLNSSGPSCLVNTVTSRTGCTDFTGGDHGAMFHPCVSGLGWCHSSNEWA
jgi:hypothetical protein